MTYLRMMFVALVATAIVSMGSSASAITAGQVDDFQDGTPQNWAHGSGLSLVPPVNLADSGMGGSGDHVLHIRTSGAGSGAGSKLLAMNRSQWIGDFISAGVTAVSVDLSNPNNVPLNVRFAIRGNNGGDWVTPDVVVPAGSGVWNNYVFSLTPGSLIADGGIDAAMALGSVNEFRLLHNPVDSIKGAIVGAAAPFAASLYADNIKAIPEPATWVMLSLGGLMISSRRRRR